MKPRAVSSMAARAFTTRRIAAIASSDTAIVLTPVVFNRRCSSVTACRAWRISVSYAERLSSSFSTCLPSKSNSRFTKSPGRFARRLVTANSAVRHTTML